VFDPHKKGELFLEPVIIFHQMYFKKLLHSNYDTAPEKSLDRILSVHQFLLQKHFKIGAERICHTL